MIKAFKNRTIDYNKPVRVYRNLNGQQGTLKYSIKQGSLVVGHANVIALKDCEFIVSKAGQARVRREKKKNVHAFIQGFIDIITSVEDYKFDPTLSITYNPYKMEGFTIIEDNTLIKSAKKVLAGGKYQGCIMVDGVERV